MTSINDYVFHHIDIAEFIFTDIAFYRQRQRYKFSIFYIFH